MRVGFIGLGAMGLPMASRLQHAGHQVITMVHRDRSRAESLVAAGAAVVDGPRAVAEVSDLVVTILPADRELRAVVTGPSGLLEGMRPGQVLIEMTTATPGILDELAPQLAARDVALLDAPVSGGTTAAADGTLTIIAGGDADVLERCRPVLETMGTVQHVGPVGQGKVVKLVNQVLAAVHLMAIGEAFALGVRAGSSPGVLYEVIRNSSGASRMMDLRLPGFLLEGNVTPGFRLDLMKKDVNLAVEAARAGNVAMPLAATAAQWLAAASAGGHGDDDFSAAAAFIAGLAGVRLGE